VNNSRFLSSISNGQGLSQTFGWKVAHSNSHGVPGGGSNNANPFYCDSSQSGYPCDEADDMGWSHVVLIQQNNTTVRLTQNGQGGQQTSTPITETTNYNYQLTYPLTAQQCSDCVAGMYWGNQNDGDYLNYYNAVFMGFAQATVYQPTGAVEVHDYYAGEGWGIYDTGQVKCYSTSPCHNDPWWALPNAAHGQETEAQYFDTDGTTLLRHVNTSYSATCPPSGVSGTPTSANFGNWDGNLVSSLDHNNPVVVCSVLQTQQTTQTIDGASGSASTTSNWTYDSYGRVTQETTTSNGGTPSKVVKNTTFVWDDNVSATKTSATGTYLIDRVAFTDTEDGSSNRLACTYTSYDGQSYLTGQTTALTVGLDTSTTKYANCGTSANGYTPSGPSTTTTTYDAYGNAIATNDADTNAGISGHTGCTASSIQHTTCSTYDSMFEVYQTAVSNALNQSTSTSYANTGALFGFGTWPMSTTDVNGQTTSATYDALGRTTGETLPGETSGDLTKQWVYTFWCSGTSAQAPCEEIDEIDRLNSSTTMTTRAFYDGEGRLVETRKPGPSEQDVVTYAYYDSAGRQIFKSSPYFVSTYTGSSGAAAYSIPDSTQPGTSTSYPNLRTTSVTDPNSHISTTTNSVVCGVSGTSDTGCYEQSMVVDANGHESATLAGGLGKTDYTQTYTGTSGSYSLYATTTYTYDAAGQLLSTKSLDGSTTTSTYDDLGHLVSQNDPDRGTTTLTYDPNGNLTESVDARGSTGTIFTGYDGLNRPLWQNSTNSSTNALVINGYDSIANGNKGIGRLTSESFTGSGGLSGSYAYTYDGRGQQIGETVTVNGTSYPVQTTYNDNGQVASETYPTGEVVTPAYTSTGWLSGLSTQSGSTVTTLASNIAYSDLAGAAGKITTMDDGNGAIYNANYDTGMRLTSASLTQASTNTLLYQTQPTYDAANNVVNVQTSIGGATDTQQFCYDSLNRLTWSGTSGTPPCSGASFSGGSLTGAGYQQSESYNVVNGFVTGPAGSYTYGDGSHPHAVTATSGGYSAAYDAAGNLICRALTTATTCSGTQTGQQLSYNPQGKLSNWQNTPTSPTQTANYLYDGAGNRVAMVTKVGSITTTTVYVGSIEEVQTTYNSQTGILSSPQPTTYYSIGSQHIAAKVNGTFYYFGYDALGSQVVVLNNSGNIVGSQLYGPYGNPRYSSGTLPTSIGFTGQRFDSVTGLNYYVARYYDPTIGQFLSADLKQGNAQGVDPYAYVGGNPETRTDPTGQRWTDGNGDTAWIASTGDGTGNIILDTPGAAPKVIGHVKLPVVKPTSSTPPGGGGKGPNTANGGTCDATCQGEKKAYQDAKNARDQFQDIAGKFGNIIWTIGGILLSALLAAIALIPGLAPMLVFGLAVISGVVGGIVAGLQEIAGMAGHVAQDFQAELDKATPDSGYSWFTTGNVSLAGSGILTDLSTDTAVDVGVDLGGAFAAIAGGGSVMLIVGQFLAGAIGMIAGGVSFGVASAATAEIGSAWLTGLASSDLDQQGNDAPCDSSCLGGYY
jgi:RHS repeat-associated protein